LLQDFIHVCNISLGVYNRWERGLRRGDGDLIDQDIIGFGLTGREASLRIIG
jgi:hypothetical protein